MLHAGGRRRLPPRPRRLDAAHRRRQPRRPRRAHHRDHPRRAPHPHRAVSGPARPGSTSGRSRPGSGSSPSRPTSTSWLVAGRDRAVLVDTGLGVAPIRPVAEAAAGMPVEAVNTHHHFDHTGGNAEFDAVAIHHLGVDAARGRRRAGVRASYLEYTRALLEAAGTYRDLDRRFFHLLTDDSDPRQLPAGFDAEAWVRPGPPPGPTPVPLHEGDVIDLGGRTLTVLHTPGHSPDSVCFLDDRDGLLFGGDTLNSGPIYAQLAGVGPGGLRPLDGPARQPGGATSRSSAWATSGERSPSRATWRRRRGLRPARQRRPVRPVPGTAGLRGRRGARGRLRAVLGAPGHLNQPPSARDPAGRRSRH